MIGICRSRCLLLGNLFIVIYLMIMLDINILSLSSSRLIAIAFVTAATVTKENDKTDRLSDLLVTSVSF